MGYNERTHSHHHDPVDLQALIDRAEALGYDLRLRLCDCCDEMMVHIENIHGFDVHEAKEWLDRAPDYLGGMCG